MITENIVKSFLTFYDIKDPELEPISSGLSGSATLVSHKEKKYVLKICKKDTGIETEARFGDLLKKKDFPVATIVKNNSNELVTTVGDYSGALFDFCTGREMGWNHLSTTFSENLAKIVARMHLLMVNDNTIVAQKRHGSVIDNVSGVTNSEIAELWTSIGEESKDIDFSELREGLVHSDLTRQNILVTENGDEINAIIDLGDAHYDYIVWDIAVLIAHVFVTKTYGIDWDALEVFTKTYYSLFSLSQQEKNVIIPFIKIRNINLAIEVNRLALKDNNNINDLLSIENSVISKMKIVEDNYHRLSELLTGNSSI